MRFLQGAPSGVRAIGVALLIGGGLIFMSPSGAADEVTQITPNAGPPGTVIEITNTNLCTGQALGDLSDVENQLLDDSFGPPGQPLQLQVPVTATPGVYLVGLTCSEADEDVEYALATFTVPDGAATAGAGAPSAPVAVPEAPVAAPVAPPAPVALPEDLAMTGPWSGALSIVGGIALLLGAWLTFGRRRHELTAVTLGSYVPVGPLSPSQEWLRERGVQPR